MENSAIQSEDIHQRSDIVLEKKSRTTTLKLPISIIHSIEEGLKELDNIITQYLDCSEEDNETLREMFKSSMKCKSCVVRFTFINDDKQVTFSQIHQENGDHDILINIEYDKQVKADYISKTITIRGDE